MCLLDFNRRVTQSVKIFRELTLTAVWFGKMKTGHRVQIKEVMNDPYLR
jgi:hypothetical protein